MKVPQYVADMVLCKLIAPAPIYEQEADAHGYTWRVYKHSNGQWESSFEAEVLRLVNWAKREYADARLVRHVWFSVKEHRKPLYRRDYAIVVITDPVAQKLEKMIEEEKKC